MEEFVEGVGPPDKPNESDNSQAHNSSLDLLEQQQAIEQARLLARFKELRTWQQRQQEQLMLQQQAQLELLKEEQEKVQNMLKIQRQQQWGAGTVKTGLSNKQTSATVMNDIHHHGDMIPNGLLHHNMQNSLPKPVIYETENNEIEGDNYTNPELFSNPGSMDQLEEGVFNAFDTGSEMSHPSSAQQLTLQHLLQSTSPETLKAMLALIPRSKLMGGDFDLSPKKGHNKMAGVSPRSKSQQENIKSQGLREEVISPRARPNKSPSPRSSGSVITELEKKNSAPSNIMDAQCGQLVKSGSPQVHEQTPIDPNNLPQNVKRHLFCDGADAESIDDEILATLAKLKPKLINNNEFKSVTDDKKDEEETLNQSAYVGYIDDRPIKPGLAGKKTFEQLLEEQLKEEERKALEEEVVESPRDKKRPFLKRGDGLARFMGNKTPKEAKNKKPDSKFKQPEKPPANVKKKTESITAPLTNTAKANQVSKAPGLKPKSAPKTTSNPGVLTQSLKLNPTKAVPKPQTSTALPQKQTSAFSNNMTVDALNKPNGLQSSTQQVRPQPSSNHDTKSCNPTPSSDDVFDPFDDDSSFAAGVRERIANEGKEQEELDEFELLEDFADNASFCSNSSIVVKLLQADKNKNKGEPVVGLKTILEAKRAELQKKKEEIVQAEVKTSATDNDDDTLIDDDALSSDTDSSISSDSELNEDNLKLLTAKLNIKNPAIINSQKGANSHVEDTTESALDPVPSKSLTRKIATKDSQGSSSLTSVSSTDVRSLLQRLTSGKGPHLGSLTSTDSSLQSVTTIPLPENGHNLKSQNIDNDDDDDDDDSEESTSVETSEDEEESKGDNKEYVNDFDDEEEWTDNAPKPKTKVDDKANDLPVKSTPPTSKLVARLFPNLNQQNQENEKQKKQQEMEKLQNTKPSDGVQSKVLRDKLAELEVEIERFRNENSVLDKLRKDREEGLAKLKKEIADFETEKADELKRFEEFKNQEMKKLKHERKMFEKYQKTIRSMPDKKDREEIDMLRNQLNELQEEMKRKETRWTSSQTRLKDKLELVELENKELKEEIKLLEKKRIEWMQKETANTQKMNGHQSYPRSSTPTKETEEKHPNINNNQISPPRSSVPTQKKSVVNQIKYPITSKSLSLTNDSLPTLHMSVGDPQPRTEPIKIAKSSDMETDSSKTVTVSSLSSSSTSSVTRKLASSNKLLIENPIIDKGNKQFEESQHNDGKIERIYKNGAREILFANGTRKEISYDGQSIIVSFFNGDIKQIFPDKRVVSILLI